MFFLLEEKTDSENRHEVSLKAHKGLSLYCDVKELKINVCPEPSSLNHSPNSLISSALMQVVGCFKEEKKCSFENRFIVVKKHFFCL